MEHKELICSLDSELTFISICSIRIFSRNWDILKIPIPLYPKFIAVTSSVLPELLIFDKFPSESTLPFKSIDIDKTAKELALAVSNNDHEIVNEHLEQLSNVSDRQLLHLWSLSEPFQARGQQTRTNTVGGPINPRRTLKWPFDGQQASATLSTVIWV